MEKENQPKRIQFVIVPEFILTNTDIPVGEKLLFGDIASHTKQEGYCWGTNDYFSKRYKVTPRTISRWINDLRRRNLIKTKMIYQKNPKEVSERQIAINTSDPMLLEYMTWYGNSCPLGIDVNIQPPVVTDVQENNKQVNNKGLKNLNKPINNLSNVVISEDEYEKLKKEFGKEKVDAGLQKYSSWKKLKNAHPKSDFESLSKWLKKAAEGNGLSYKSRMPAVKESGADAISDKELDEISALIQVQMCNVAHGNGKTVT